jgi:hypothetical protein
VKGDPVAEDYFEVFALGHAFRYRLNDRLKSDTVIRYLGDVTEIEARSRIDLPDACLRAAEGFVRNALGLNHSHN